MSVKKRKEFMGVLELSYEYVDDEDTIPMSDDDLRWEMISWLEDLGFVVEHIGVLENRRAG
jgi:hypothetical protein